MRDKYPTHQALNVQLVEQCDQEFCTDGWMDTYGWLASYLGMEKGNGLRWPGNDAKDYVPWLEAISQSCQEILTVFPL